MRIPCLTVLSLRPNPYRSKVGCMFHKQSMEMQRKMEQLYTAVAIPGLSPDAPRMPLTAKMLVHDIVVVAMTDS